MKLLYFLLFNFSIFSAQDNFNYLPVEVKFNIVKYMQSTDLPNLRVSNKQTRRFFVNNFDKVYWDFKEKNKHLIFEKISKNSDLNNITKVVILLNKLNRLYDIDVLCDNPIELIKAASMLRFSPQFLLLGGQQALNKLCCNYKINTKTYAPIFKSLLRSINCDKLLFTVIFFTCTYLIIQDLKDKYDITKANFSELPEYYESHTDNVCGIDKWGLGYVKDKINIYKPANSQDILPAKFYRLMHYPTCSPFDPLMLSLISKLNKKLDNGVLDIFNAKYNCWNNDETINTHHDYMNGKYLVKIDKDCFIYNFIWFYIVKITWIIIIVITLIANRVAYIWEKNPIQLSIKPDKI